MIIIIKSLPTEEVARKKWITLIEQHQSFDRFAVYLICELHFNSEDFKTNGNLKNEAIPTKFNHWLVVHGVDGLNSNIFFCKKNLFQFTAWRQTIWKLMTFFFANNNNNNNSESCYEMDE